MPPQWCSDEPVYVTLPLREGPRPQWKGRGMELGWEAERDIPKETDSGAAGHPTLLYMFTLEVNVLHALVYFKTAFLSCRSFS